MLLMMLAYTSSSVETEGLGTRLLILMIKISLTLWRHYKVNNGAWFYLKHSLHSLLSSILKDWLRPYLLFSIYIACALSVHLNYTPSEQHVHHTLTQSPAPALWSGLWRSLPVYLMSMHACVISTWTTYSYIHTYIHTYIHRYGEFAKCYSCIRGSLRLAPN